MENLHTNGMLNVIRHVFSPIPQERLVVTISRVLHAQEGFRVMVSSEAFDRFTERRRELVVSGVS